jgi:hypothetical protein
MPNPRSDGKPRSAPVGRVKAASRESGSAKALALTRPAGIDNTSISRSPLTDKTVAEEAPKAPSRRMRRAASEAPSPFATAFQASSGLTVVPRLLKQVLRRDVKSPGGFKEDAIRSRMASPLAPMLAPPATRCKTVPCTHAGTCAWPRCAHSFRVGLDAGGPAGSPTTARGFGAIWRRK